MLELAETMIDLKLPILLVAPKEKGYTFLEEKGDFMEEKVITPSREDWEDPQINSTIAPKGGRDALFMGLGDVIFPGMLVISALSFLPESGHEISYAFGSINTYPLFVSMGVLFGGLIGYLGLMAQVAKGKPQAGLPLLNGGAILGYLISGIIVYGSIDVILQIPLF
jgi:presenilin-like A22 family membrane protease